MPFEGDEDENARYARCENARFDPAEHEIVFAGGVFLMVCMMSRHFGVYMTIYMTS